ncbi:MAG: hypothetical protein ACI9GW_003457 [Halieaceae bacterium]|jgi:hypothetical protein
MAKNIAPLCLILALSACAGSPTVIEQISTRGPDE